MCMVQRDGGVLLRRSSTDAGVEVLQPDDPSARRGQGKVVLLLPRRDYLVKVLETPEVTADEAARMLPLEVETLLPPDYGAVEVSYRSIESRPGRLRWEVYIVRREIIEDQLARLRQVGLAAQFVLPSAVAWAGLLGRAAEVDLVVAAAHGVAEAASKGPGGAVLVRALDDEGRGVPSASVMVEFLRSVSAGVGRQPLRMAWVGDQPEPALDGAAEFVELSLEGGGGVADSLLGLACLGACGLDHQTMSLANLVPEESRRRAARMALCRHAAVSAAMLTASMLLVWAAIELRCGQYRGAISQLDRKVSGIRREGETAGRRVSQMLAIRSALDSSRDFYDVIQGLLDSTPEGVSYNKVELLPTGELLLQGQAQSVSLPFLLPEQLQRQPAFDQVVLKNAGSKAGGGITEFRVECRLQRGGRR